MEPRPDRRRRARQIPLTRTYPDQGHGGVSVTAFPADTTTLPPPAVLEGRWLDPGETGAVVINQIVRKNTLPDVQAGDAVQLFVGGKPTTWRVVGIVQEREGNGSVYATAEGFAAAMDQPPGANQLRIVTDRHDEPSRQAVADAVDEALTNAGIAVGSAASISRSDAASEAHLGPLVTIILAIAIAMGIVGGIGLASTMSANILDRTREFGVMHAIGALPKAVRRIVTAEGVFLALASLLRRSSRPCPHHRPRRQARQPVHVRPTPVPDFDPGHRRLGRPRHPRSRPGHRSRSNPRRAPHRPRSPRLPLTTPRRSSTSREPNHEGA